ncbi:MAG TPA: carbon-phosphorus lyase complex subunit PhnI [Hypericibacter adhaerens]|jgi:alpha-D-ribose 1-methylphosphonate 5-triphosphate synthase subunit PhnI|uniref:Carbon-phosphorus lyase complex subunit PhnI n=1 Tax=Hypericibacter adhaerens TaxID=2602016 RepID=A0A5J6MXH5_9PROT|nr:carbon-phosphorus lyase complex subunit PhnI [Hypericibacter adhaerens]QEX22011.1 carbon-phosphorus lyase complex subunit PhnI [Hypericibacter adhaerens]HWA46330.1 carbon-phosphorus lyase complex subunit PhnI [Hypericibacter adhaerens]
MYVAVKGGEAAIEAAHRLLEQDRRGDADLPALTVDQIEGQLRLAVDRVMAEGALYDRRLAALAIKQAAGDLVEAIFLLRAYRTTLPRFAVSEPIDTARMEADRRISAIFKDVPGGQFLGPTFDYTHRLLDFSLEEETTRKAPAAKPGATVATATAALPPVMGWLEQEGLMEPERPDPALPVGDITREPPSYPATRDVRLQALARGDEGFLLSLAYSTQRGYGRNHPFAGEIRSGRVTVEIVPEELGFPVAIGEIELTECQLVNQFKGSATQPPQFTRGYGLVFGRCERKAMAMALVDRSLRAAEFEETVTAPAQDEEFVLSHADNVEASGFVQHLKLPHYVDFQAELDIVRRMRAEEAQQEAAE